MILDNMLKFKHNIENTQYDFIVLYLLQNTIFPIMQYIPKKYA